MRIFQILLMVLLLPVGAMAQQRDSVFANYAEYDAFLDENIMDRAFISLIQHLGGRDEYTQEQLTGLHQRFTEIFPVDFRHKTVFRREDLGGGMAQEARAYWIGDSYIYFYALIHDRGDEFVVINFHLNSSVSKVMAKF